MGADLRRAGALARVRLSAGTPSHVAVVVSLANMGASDAPRAERGGGRSQFAAWGCALIAPLMMLACLDVTVLQSEVTYDPDRWPTVISVLLDEDRVVSATVLDRPSVATWQYKPQEESTDTTVKMLLLLYPSSMARLGLREGPLVLRKAFAGRALPFPEEVLELPGDPDAQRHQETTELPPVKPRTTEFRQHAVACPAATTRTQAPSGHHGKESSVSKVIARRPGLTRWVGTDCSLAGVVPRSRPSRDTRASGRALVSNTAASGARARASR